MSKLTRPDSPATAGEVTDVDEETAETGEMHTPATKVDVPSVLPKPLATGTRVGRYVIIDRLGSGGMGVVYKAYDPELSRLVAIKLLRLRRHVGADLSRRRARLLREAQAMAQLSHPNVIAVYDAGTYGNDVFVAMELVEGTVLRKWLRAEQRSYREIVEVMIAAGRGLAAAHEAGLVHRDFKPDNVILGERGRVRVLDFGLARAAGGRFTEEFLLESLEDLEEVETREHLLSNRLTREGAVVGTPVYMPPEQLQGKEVNERSDQFAFCVALFEALYGKRPFTGRDPGALTQAMTQGRIREVADARKVPAWLRRVVLRGLAAKPEDRFANMHELLDELGRDPAATRRTLAAVAGVGLLTGLAVFGLLRDSGAGSRKCQSAAARVESVWHADAKKGVEQKFLETERPHAADTYGRVESLLGEYTAAWATMHTEACEATHAHGTQSQALLDLRMACLDRRLQLLGALVKVFSAEASADVVDRAVQAVLSLPRLERCADANALTAVIPPPEDPSARAAVAEARRRVDRAHALEAAGRYADAVPIAANVVDEARRIGYAPLLAEVLLRKGAITDKAGDTKAAEALWYEAAQVASEARDDHLATSAWIELIWTVGYRQTRVEEAMVLYKVANATLARTGDEGELRAQLLSTIGLVHMVKGEYDVAIEKLEQGLELRQRVLGSQHISVVSALDALGVASEYRGRIDEAIDYAERALAIREANFGAEHPDLAFSLTNLGEAYLAQAQYDKAHSNAERAVRIRERSLGPRHPALGAPLATLGSVAQAEKRYDVALQYLVRATDIFESTAGPDHAGLGGYYQRLADLHRERGDCEAALAAYERARSIFVGAVGEGHPDVAVVLTGKGECMLKIGKRKDALSTLERALAISLEAKSTAMRVATTRFALARALWDSRRTRKRALSLTRQARDAYQAIDTPLATSALADVEAWLAERD